jgi:hypothetical protein
MARRMSRQSKGACEPEAGRLGPVVRQQRLIWTQEPGNL